MLLDRYQTEMDAVGPSREQMERLLDAIGTQPCPSRPRRVPFRHILVAAALCIGLTLTALAVNENWDILSAFFRGDTSPAQEYVNSTAYSVSDKNYTFTVEGSAADKNTLYVVVTVKALNEKAKTALFAPLFHDMDTFNFYIPAWAEKQQEEGEPTNIAYGGFGGGEIKIQSEDTRKFQLHANLRGIPETVEIWLGQMGREYSLSIPITPAPTLTLELNATGIGYHATSAAPISLTVQRVHLSPFNFLLEITEASTLEATPRFLFRMSDGTIRTQAQMMEFRGSSATEILVGTYTADYIHQYRFQEVQALENITSLIVFGMEYPLDGSAPFPAEHDSALDPFTLPQMENYLLPVRALTERLGGTCDWDPETGEVTCTYRGVSVVLRPGSDTALVDREPVKMGLTPELQNGTLCAGGKPFFDAWGVDGFVTHTSGDEIPDPGTPGVSEIETFYHDWYIIP